MDATCMHAHLQFHGSEADIKHIGWKKDVILQDFSVPLIC